MQRPERVVLTSLGALFCGIFSDCTLFDPMLILIVPLAIIAVLANLTAFVRLAHCYKLLNNDKKIFSSGERNDVGSGYNGGFPVADGYLYRAPSGAFPDGGFVFRFVFCWEDNP